MKRSRVSSSMIFSGVSGWRSSSDIAEGEIGVGFDSRCGQIVLRIADSSTNGCVFLSGFEVEFPRC